jgi:hypothetical protein
MVLWWSFLTAGKAFAWSFASLLENNVDDANGTLLTAGAFQQQQLSNGVKRFGAYADASRLIEP